jgi:preprotein translocase subunit SecD
VTAGSATERRGRCGWLAAVVLALAGGWVHPNAAQERAPGVQRSRYVLAVDPTRVRAVGWTEPEADDAAAVASAAAVVRRRLESMERSFQLDVDAKALRLELAMPSIAARDRSLFTEMLESLGVGEFLIIAQETSLAGLDLDLTLEKVKLDAWRLQNPTRPLAAFDALAPGAGPPLRLQWLETQFGDRRGPPIPVLLPERPEEHFGAATFRHTSVTKDTFGYPALAVEFADERADDLGSFTEARVNQQLGIVFEGRVRAAPTLNGKLTDRAIIEGRFEEDEVQELAEALVKLEGPLKVLEVR